MPFIAVYICIYELGLDLEFSLNAALRYFLVCVDAL